MGWWVVTRNFNRKRNAVESSLIQAPQVLDSFMLKGEGTKYVNVNLFLPTQGDKLRPALWLQFMFLGKYTDIFEWAWRNYDNYEWSQVEGYPFFLHSTFPDEIRNGNCLSTTCLSLWGRYTYQVHIGVKESNDKNTREVKRELSFSFYKLSDHSQRRKMSNSEILAWHAAQKSHHDINTTYHQQHHYLNDDALQYHGCERKFA